jgi:hypothetical protein
MAEEDEHIEYCETDQEFEAGELRLYYVNERKLQRCPHVELYIGCHPVTAVVDSGSEATIISQEVYDKLINSNVQVLHIPITGAVLVSAWGNRTKKIKLQALIPFTMSGNNFEHNCLIAPGMIADCIIGADFLDKFQATVDFKDQCMFTNDEIGCKRHQFMSDVANAEILKTENPTNAIRDSPISQEEGEAGHTILIDKSANDKVEESRCCVQDETICACVSTDAPDPRAIQTSELRDKVKQASGLSVEQRDKLFNILLKYKCNFMSSPGRCKVFQYKFKVAPEGQLVGHSRPIPFAVRSAVRAQIKQLLEDGIIKPSDSSYLNPLTIVLREGKSPRICLDARKVNQWTSPDRTRVAPVSELLQRFRRSKFITSIDLSSAFLQVPLGHESRKFTAFLHEGQLYQYTRTPYGFKNSLAAFVRALQITLGTETSDYALAHVDDIVCHSESFDHYLGHLDTVLRKLTEAGFTINASECKLCRVELPFLGHVISEGGE